MYLGSSDHLQRPVKPSSSPVDMQPKRYIRKEKKQRQKQHPCDKLVAFRERMQEEDAELKTRIKMLTDFFKNITDHRIRTGSNSRAD
jgi:hypothetical protein